MSDDKDTTERTKPFAEQVIHTIVDGAAELTKSAAKTGLDLLAKKVTKTKPGKAVLSVTKKVKKAASKKKTALKRTAKKTKKKTAKKSAKKTAKKTSKKKVSPRSGSNRLLKKSLVFSAPS